MSTRGYIFNVALRKDVSSLDVHCVIHDSLINVDTGVGSECVQFMSQNNIIKGYMDSRTTVVYNLCIYYGVKTAKWLGDSSEIYIRLD